jgi:ribosomal protein S18 acetylase RimI-like enzyme
MALIVRRLHASDTASSSRLHGEVLGVEFLARLGRGFLRCYHRAWIDSPHGLALAAVDEAEDAGVLGVLLGSLQPADHYRAMVRRHGPALALWLLLGSARHPAAARQLLGTRVVRYLRGLGRMLWGARPGASSRAGGEGRGATERRERAVGEVTHVMVRADAQRRGVGRLLLEEARRQAEEGGLDELVLVTPPELAARRFYEHLGWEPAGELRSRSGEPFVRYRLVLGKT